MDVNISLAHGPVYMKWLEGKGLDNEYHLWDSICCHEFFPKDVESANYVLTLKKHADHSDQVWVIEKELTTALQKLSEAWIFSGGSLFPVKEKSIVYQPSYLSNAQEIENNLLAKEGITKVVSTHVCAFESGCTYYDAPLKNAIDICKAATSMPEIQKIVKYYTEARLDSEKWFVDLHKVRDSLSMIYGSDKKAIEALGIEKKEWNFFGNVLNNNDLRHPPRGGVVLPTVSRGDKNKVESIAWKWVIIFLEHENIVSCKYPI